MVRYMEHLEGRSSGYLIDFGLGDWGAFDGSTPRGLVVSCTYYYLARTMADCAALLDKPEDEQKYRELAGHIRDAVNETYYDPQTKSYGSGSQASNAMALYYGVNDPADQDAIVENLVQSVRDAGDHLTTGEIALKPLFLSLGENGANDVVYDMVSNKTNPSYWYFIEQGATSLPEFWDMSLSQNHCMMGHFQGWIYEQLAGIHNNGIAYQQIIIDSYFPDDLNFIDISTVTPYCHPIWKSCLSLESQSRGHRYRRSHSPRQCFRYSVFAHY